MNEPKNNDGKSVSELVDEAFDTQAPAQESSPEVVQTVETPVRESDSPKTPITEESPEQFRGVDKGSANHPKWIERENKMKEYQQEAERLRPIATLLDDPVVYRRYLERQGYNPQEIEKVMRQKGMSVEQYQAPQKTQAQDDIDQFVATVCKARGWDYDNLKPEEKSYIKDLISMTDEVVKQRTSGLMDSRLKPLESYHEQVARQQKEMQSVSDAKALATRYKFDFDKDILPAIKNKLDELDRTDPLGKQPFDIVSYTKDLVLDLIEERKSQQGRQEERQDALKNAKPLKAGAPIVADKAKKGTGKSIGSIVDEFYAASGVRD